MDSQPVTPAIPIDPAPAGDADRRSLAPDVATLFARRAKRFRTLAQGHPLGDWLAFLADLSDAQQDATASLAHLSDLTLPDAEAIAQSRTHALPVLTGRHRPPRSLWHRALRELAKNLQPRAPEPARAALDALIATPERFDALALALLNDGGVPQDAPAQPPSAALLPFVGAALQVVWSAQAARLDPTSLGHVEDGTLCPCCGSSPVASVVRTDDAINNLRYLHCALCNTEWNRPRATCTACGDEASVAYQQIEHQSGAVRAETCDRCRSYLKIVYQEKDSQVDPVADDLATLALDLLLDEAGYARSGPNFLLAGAGA